MARLDRKGKRERWTKARAAENLYNTQLRAVARQIGLLIKGMAPEGLVTDLHTLTTALYNYAETIRPWAKSVSEYMLADVVRRDKTMWRKNSQALGEGVRAAVTNSPVSAALARLQQDQVRLITSLPREAAERVHKLTLQSLVDSRRASEIAREIAATGEVTESRARLIARTEVTRASSNLVQVRSEYAGSEGYIWRTSGDFDVRDSHAGMEGKYVRWSSPPTLDNLTGHAGTLPNCRCFAEPIFPDY